MTASSRSRPSRRSGCLLALAIGFVTVAIFAGAHSFLAGVPLNLAEEWGNFLYAILMVAFPFALLAVVGVRGRWSWGVAVTLTALIWCVFLIEGLRAGYEGTRVNFLLIAFMLFAPAFIAVAGLVAARISKEI